MTWHCTKLNVEWDKKPNWCKAVCSYCGIIFYKIQYSFYDQGVKEDCVNHLQAVGVLVKSNESMIQMFFY